MANSLSAAYPGLGAVPQRLLANTMYAMAILNYRPASGWVGEAASSLEPRLLLLEAAELVNALWAMAKWGVQPESSWRAAAVQALQLQLASLAPHQMSYGLGSLQVSKVPRWGPWRGGGGGGRRGMSCHDGVQGWIR